MDLSTPELKKTITLQENESVSVNGAVLTAGCADWLKEFQSNENAAILEIREHLAESVSLLLMAMEYLDEKTASEMLKNAKYISLTSRHLVNFSKIA